MQLKILSFNSHEPYIYLLAKTGHNFFIVNKLRKGREDWWKEQRPVPLNVRFLHFGEAFHMAANGIFDIIICHDVSELPFVLGLKTPKILVIHNKISTMLKLGGDKTTKKEYLKQFKETISDDGYIRLAFISESKKVDWELEGYIIPPGIDITEYNGYRGNLPKVLRVGNYMTDRNIMFRVDIQDKILDGLPHTTLGKNPEIPNSSLSKSWDHLKSYYRSHRVYLNTLAEPYEDGYNLALLEAMATGMPVVSLSNTTSPIQNGTNGFVSGDLQELREYTIELLKDHNKAKSLGKNARETVRQLFPIENFIKRWNQILEDSIHPITSPTKLRKKRSLKLLFAYVYYPATTGRHLYDGLKELPECELYSCGPKINSEGITSFNLKGTELEHIKGENDIPLWEDPLWDDVKKRLPKGWYPDVLLYVETGLPFFIKDISSLDCLKACYLIDTHLNFDYHINLSKYFDVIFLAQKEYVEKFKQFGIKNTYWLPLACDPKIHGKKTEFKLFNISFVGSLTDPKRVEVINHLRDKFGLYYERCFLEKMSFIYSLSKIVFNISIRNDLNMRVFEAMASGAMLLTDKAPNSGLDELFVDKYHLVTYDNLSEIDELLSYYLKHDAERDAIALNGMKCVLTSHTYKERARYIVSVLSEFI